MSLLILPVTGDYRMLLAHACADKAELTTAVRSLVEVHKVHVDAVPRKGRIELGVELQQRFIEDSQAVDPHFGWREGMQPDHQTRTTIVIVRVTANGGDFIRCGPQWF